MFLRVSKRSGWLTVSKAFARSMNIPSEGFPLSRELYILPVSREMASCADFPVLNPICWSDNNWNLFKYDNILFFSNFQNL